MRVFVALLFAVHGFAHLVGFAGAWNLSREIAHKTTILGGRFDAGDAGIRVIGLLWLVAALAFAAAGAAALARAPWWPAAAMGVTAASLVLCAIEWPETRIGLAIDAALIAFLAAGVRGGWFAVG
jgi:hypothetical protein